MLTPRVWALIVGLALAASLIAAPARAQKSKVNAGLAAYAAKKWDAAAVQIAEGLKDTTNMKPKDLGKANLRLAQALLQIHLAANTPIFQADYNKRFPNRLEDAYRAIMKAISYDTDGKLAPEINVELPQLFNGFQQRGSIAYNEKSYASSVANLNYAIELIGLPALASNKAAVGPLTQLRAYANLYAGDTLKCINDLMTYVRITPDTTSDVPQMYNNLVLLVRGFEKNDAKALSILEEATRKFPSNEDLRNQELSIYSSNPDLREQAMAKFGKAYEANPNNAFVALNYASMLDQAKRGEEAAAIYLKLIDLPEASWGQMSNNRWIAYYSVARGYVNQAKDLIDAANDLVDKKKIDNKSYEAEKVKMKALLSKGLPYLEKSYELNSKDRDILNTLFQVSVLLEDEAKTKLYSDKKKEMDGGN